MGQPPTVLVINTTPDVVDMLRMAFQHAGFTTFSLYTHDVREGRVDLDAFMRQHDPKVVLYDIAPPCQGNWQLCQHVMSLPVMKGRHFILTSTNAQQLHKLVGQHRQIFEVVDTPYELEQLIQAVRQALRLGPTT